MKQEPLRWKWLLCVGELEQIWSWYREQRNKQRQGQGQNTGVLRCAQNGGHFSYLFSICGAALADEEFGAAALVDPDAAAIGTPGAALDAG
jgi:hypothetical protein